MIVKGVFDPILDIVYQTMPRDNLLNSACLELFEFIKRENLKQLLVPLVEGYREKLLGITYVSTFGALVLKYEQIQSGFNPDETSFSTQGGETPNRSLVAGGQRWQGLKDADAEEEAYFNANSDDEAEDEGATSLPETVIAKAPEGGPPMRPLVSYPEDEDEDAMEMLAASPSTPAEKKEPSVETATSETLETPSSVVPEKRRREDDDEDDLEKLAGAVPAKRRSSVSSISSVRSDMSAANLDSPTATQQQNGTEHPLRRKGSLRSKDGSPGPQKGISIGPISLSLSGKTSNEEGGG
jgi:protein phosphatase-4 regulatory subunit 3